QSNRPPAISADGRLIAFWSLASDLVAGDTNNAADVFVRNRAAPTTVSGIKFNDMNGDGTQAQSGEPPLQGWTIRAYNDSGGNGSLSSDDTIAAHDTTDANGHYSFDLDPGK